MKKVLKYIYRTTLAFGLLVSVGSCTLFDLNINTDPNNPSKADFALLLTSAQLSTLNFFNNFNNDAHGFMGILASSDSYNLQNTSYSGGWNDFYFNGMKDLEEIIKAAEASPTGGSYLGVAQVMKAYYFGLFVDLFGEAPYTEAFAGNYAEANINPKFDDDKDIYEDLIKLCDKAVANLAKAGQTAVGGDLYYGGSTASWTRLANTVKLRLLMNSRLARNNAAEINAILTGGNYIQTAAQDFQFRYNRVANPEGRHPWFQSAYVSNPSSFTYFLHQYMYEMLLDDDPRFPFYFKRQTTSVLNPNDQGQANTIPCSQASGCTYAYFVLNQDIIKALYTDKKKPFTNNDRLFLAGIFGRDRGDISGIPQDVNFRTSPGAYPAAGAYDDLTFNAAGTLTASITGNTAPRRSGDGITPFITSWMTKFYQIEAILSGISQGNARTLFETAMREQMAKVVSVGTAADVAAIAPTTAAINAYVNLYLKRYDEAPNNAQKLNVVLKQAWFCNIGNGHEMYTSFRRTGYPNDIQKPINRFRQFPLRLPQPQQETDLNKNAPKTPPAWDAAEGAIFWDVVKFKFQ